MVTLERTYNIPLRKEFLKVPRYRRAKKAVTALRQFLVRHMKSEHIIIGSYLNSKIWERGIKNPPHHVKVTAIKDEKGIVTAELVGTPKPQPAKQKGQKPEKAAAEEAKEAKKEQVQKDAEELKEALSGEVKQIQDEIKKAEEEAKRAEVKGGLKEDAAKAEAKSGSEKPAKAAAKKPRKAAEEKETPASK